MDREDRRPQRELDGPYRDEGYEPYGANPRLLLQERQALQDDARRAREGLMAQMMVDALQKP